MPEYNLKSALAKVHKKPVNFAFYRGEDADQILITPKPPGQKDIAQIQAECGKVKCVMKGVCYRREDKKLVFATRLTPAPAWEMLLTALLKTRKCGELFPIEVRQLKPNEAEDVSDEDESSSPHPPDPALAARWAELKAALLPGIKQALASGALKNAVSRIVGEASALEKKEDYQGAITHFEELKKVIGWKDPAPPLAPPVPPPSASPASTASTPSTSPRAAVRPPKPGKLQAALNKIAPAIKLAVQRNPDRKREILLPVVAFQKQLGQDELEEARATLGKIGNLVKSLL
jgi:hypothetical protein